MSQGDIIAIGYRAILVATIIGMPILGICLIVGIIISIFETATQIHEQSLSFVPKLIVVALAIAVLGGWMARQLISFTNEIFSKIAGM